MIGKIPLPIKVLGAMTVALLMLTSIAGAAEYAYVLHGASNSISVIDTTDNTLKFTMPTLDWPTEIIASSDGERLFVPQAYNLIVSVFDTANNQLIDTINIGELENPGRIAISPDGSKIYSTNWLEDWVSIVDTATHVVSTVKVGDYPIGVAVSPDGQNVYVANAQSDTVSVIDATTKNIKSTINVGDYPMGVAVSPDGQSVYVTNALSNTVSMIDVITGAVTPVDVGIDPEWVAVSPDGQSIYVTNTQSDTVSVINVATGAATSVNVGDCPTGVAVSPDGKSVYVTNTQSSTVSIIDVATGVVTPVSVGIYPCSVVVISFPERPNTPPTTNPVTITNTESLVPTISWTYADVENNPQQLYELEVCTGPWGQGTKMWSQSQSSVSSSVIYGGAALDFGKTYYVRVRAFDGIDWGEWTETSIILAFAGENIDTTFGSFPNGYSFGNSEAGEYSWEQFCNVYGKGRAEIDGAHRPGASSFYDNYFKNAGETGRCFGMTASSILLYSSGVDTSGVVAPSPMPPAWAGIGPSEFGYTPLWVMDFIDFYQPLQYSKACINEESISIGLEGTYKELKKRMSSDWKQSPSTLSFDLTDKSRPGEYLAHAVVPYRIEESNGRAKIFVYDPNLPVLPDSSEDPSDPYSWNKYIEINLNTWEVSDYQSGASTAEDLNNFQLKSLAAFKERPEIPDNIYDVSAGANMRFTDTSGNQLGYFQGERKDDIFGACFLRTIGGTADGNGVESYYVPDSSIKTELCGISSGISTASILTPNGLISMDMSVSPGSIDECKVLNEGTGVEFRSGSGTSSLGLMVDVETADSAQIVRADLSQIDAGGIVDLSNNNGVIFIKNSGSARTSNLYLEQMGANPNSDDSLKNIEIEADSTVVVKPSDWNDIANTEIVIEHDVGSDGIIDSTEIVRSKVVPTLPVASFVANVTEGAYPLDVQFTSSSTDAEAYQWNFGDGSDNSTLKDPVHTYSSTGLCAVALTVSNANGTSSLSMQINVTEQPVTDSDSKLKKPVADFRADIRKGMSPLSVQFTDASQHVPTAWSWDFGDGSLISVEQDPAHIYNQPGNYTVNLTVSNEAGTDTKIIKRFIKVEGSQE